jgi:uncharacterized protein
MIIDLKSITGVARRFDFVLEPDWWQDDDDSGQVLGLDGALTCHIDIVRAGMKFIIDGGLAGAFLFRCDRCLETYRRELDLDFRLFLSTNYPDEVEDEAELSEDDLSIEFVKGDEVELNDIIKEQVYLSLPMKSLCRADCSGLCPVCGANLNKVGCQCQRGEGHSGFGKLRALLLNGEQ